MGIFSRIDINIFAIILLGVIYFIAYKRLDKQDSLNKIFLRVSLIIILQLFIETSTCVFNKRPEQWLVPIASFLHVCLFTVTPILTYYWCVFIKNLIAPDGVINKKVDFFFMLPVVLGIIITVLSPFYNFVFYIDSSNAYHRGKLSPFLQQ